MNRALRFTLLALAIVVIATGCDGEGVSHQTGAARLNQSGQACVGVGKPIIAQAVLRTLRRAGYSMTRSRLGSWCRGYSPKYDTIAFLSNDPNDQYPQAIQNTQGLLDCEVRRGPIYSAFRADLHEAPNSPIYSGRKAAWSFDNVDCEVYAGDTHPDQQVARIDRVMRSLASRK
jgi:hypothetical protein